MMQRIPADTARRIRQLREQGKSVRAAAEIAGVGKSTVARYAAIQFSETSVHRCKKCGARVTTDPCLACATKAHG